VRTHIVFEMPGPREREMIWQAQLHPTKTPLADDVDFKELAERYAISGGEIKNAVLKAAHMAAAEDGMDYQKRIAHRHFEAAVRTIVETARLLKQPSMGYAAADEAGTSATMQSLEEHLLALERESEELRRQLDATRENLNLLGIQRDDIAP
jgi:SpoVK/Ycf46/Vps4 family AAA+-type ATPase